MIKEISVKQTISKLNLHKQLVFSLLWLMFIIVELDAFGNLLHALREKLFKDNGLLPTVAMIEYVFVVICIFAPMVALNIAILFALPLKTKIFGIETSNSMANKLKTLTFTMIQGLKNILTLSFLLALLGLTGLTIEGELGILTKRLAYELTNLETAKLIVIQIINHMELFSALIAILPLTFCCSLTLVIHIICLSVSAFPMTSILIGITSGLFLTKFSTD